MKVKPIKKKSFVQVPAKKVRKDAGQTDGLTYRDYESGQEVRWCPGCGDYSILKQMQMVLPSLGVKKKDIVFVSGIGCSSRFPYYMNTYGMHSIHGRATAIASGLKGARPDLSVWVVSGDGDGLSIGGNHTAHFLRRNFNVNMMLFNNEIYGLTKGQYSPTSPENSVTKSTPYGSIDHPFNPLSFALGSDAGFVARTMDRDPLHLQSMIKRAHSHYGATFLEIYQNCNIFNDGAFFVYSEKGTKKQHALFLEHGKPLVFGENEELGIRMDGMKPQVVKIGEEYSLDDLWIHDEKDPFKAYGLSRFFNTADAENGLPRPFGVFFAQERPVYEDLLQQQVEEVKKLRGEPDLDALIAGHETWEIK